MLLELGLLGQHLEQSCVDFLQTFHSQADNLQLGFADRLLGSRNTCHQVPFGAEKLGLLPLQFQKAGLAFQALVIQRLHALDLLAD